MTNKDKGKIMELVEKRLVRELINNRFSNPKAMLDELEAFSVKQGVSLESLDEDAKETVSHLVECYEDDCFTKDERVMLAGIALKARLRFQLNRYLEEYNNDKENEDKEC